MALSLEPRLLAFVTSCGAFLVCLGGTVLALPNSILSKTTPIAQSGPASESWPSPATGSLVGSSDDTYVLGAGLLSDAGSTTYNNWITTYADTAYSGQTTDVDEGAWELFVGYPGNIKAKTHYTPTGLFPVMENFRAETTLMLEVRGDFNGGGEFQVVVDSYTTEGTTIYDADGGGTPPASYVNGGISNVLRATSGVKVNEADVGPAFGTAFVEKNDIQFNLYCRGKQYMRCESEEDVSLYTTIAADGFVDLDGDSDLEEGEEATGFRGWLRSYHKDGENFVLLQTHPIG